MPAFEVVSEYTPSGDQPQAIAKLAQGMQLVKSIVVKGRLVNLIFKPQ